MNPREEAEKDLVGRWHDAADLRNRVAHGSTDPMRDWQDMLETYLAYSDRLRRLEAVVQQAVGS